jgi:hypothetical protein
MDHRTTVILAEQHRADLLAEAANARAHRRTRAAAPRSLRAWLTRRPPS